MIADANLWMACGKQAYLLIEHPEQRRALACVRGRIARRYKGKADGCVGHEEVTAYSLVATCTRQGCHLPGQHAAHAHRVCLYQLWEHHAELARQVFAVLLPLPLKMTAGQQRVEVCVGRSVDIGWQVGDDVVDSIGQQVFVKTIEDVADDRVFVLCQQRIDKRIAGLDEHVGVLPFKNTLSLMFRSAKASFVVPSSFFDDGISLLMSSSR